MENLIIKTILMVMIQTDLTIYGRITEGTQSAIIKGKITADCLTEYGL